jgi:hypothetical protein
MTPELFLIGIFAFVLVARRVAKARRHAFILRRLDGRS